LLLKRGRVRAAPRYQQFDAYRGKWVRGWLPGGNRNPLQRLKLAFAYRLAARFSREAMPPPLRAASDVEAILDAARWAPSGDNLQPWRFEVVGESRVIVHIRRSGGVYDYADGEPTLLAAGFLLQTMRIAASGHRRSAAWQYLGQADGLHRIAVDLSPDDSVEPDPLLPFVPVRSVARGAYRRTPLDAAQKTALEATLGDGLTIEWHESLAERWRQAWLNAMATDIRLRIPEAHAVHREVVDWERDFSPTGIPGAAIGLDPLTRRLTRWLMREWRRIVIANRLGGTGLARLEMDLIPGLCCAAHFAIRAAVGPEERRRPEYLFAAGAALDRFWLTATRLGLALQPGLAPLCFAHYGRDGVAFTGDPRAAAKARRLTWEFDHAGDGSSDGILYRGRIGEPCNRRVVARSLRRSLDELRT